MNVSRVARLIGYASLGPISGPMAARAVAAFGRGDRVLGVSWLVAIPFAWGVLAMLPAFLKGLAA